LAETGCDAFTLAKIAGHSSITITQRYCHPQAEAIERAFARKAANGRELVTEGGHPKNLLEDGNPVESALTVSVSEG
jgi:heat shock protein HslJ